MHKQGTFSCSLRCIFRLIFIGNIFQSFLDPNLDLREDSDHYRILDFFRCKRWRLQMSLDRIFSSCNSLISPIAVFAAISASSLLQEIALLFVNNRHELLHLRHNFVSLAKNNDTYQSKASLENCIQIVLCHKTLQK